jgi:hypothetical protein
MHEEARERGTSAPSTWGPRVARPQDDFDVRLIQIEQLAPESFPAQRGRQQRIERHMSRHGYTMVRRIVVAERDTYDLVFERDWGALGSPGAKRVVEEGDVRG